MTWLEEAKSKLSEYLNQPAMPVDGLICLPLDVDTEELQKAISSLCNIREGGFLVLGVGQRRALKSIQKSESHKLTLRDRVTQIAAFEIEPPANIDCAYSLFQDHEVLFIKVMEEALKPAFIKSQGIFYSYKRLHGETRLCSRNEIGQFLISTSFSDFEQDLEPTNLSENEVRQLFNLCSSQKEQNPFRGKDELTISDLVESKLVNVSNGSYRVRRCGLLLLETNPKHLNKIRPIQHNFVKIRSFEPLRQESKIREYLNNSSSRLPLSPGVRESAYVIKDILPNILKNTLAFLSNQRRIQPYVDSTFESNSIYFPEKAIEEILRNAINFSLYADNDEARCIADILYMTDRVIIESTSKLDLELDLVLNRRGACPNKIISSWMQKTRTTQTGKGLVTAVKDIEECRLPAPRFEMIEDRFRATIYHLNSSGTKRAKREDNVRACYQHSCVQYALGSTLTNESLRERMGISKSNYPFCSKIISQAVLDGVIKRIKTATKSNREAMYLPYWVVE